MFIRDKAFRDALLRFTLRVLPMVPAPEMYDLIKSISQSEKDLDRQVREAFDALSKSSELVSSLEGLLQDRQAKLLTLQKEYERVSQLSTITETQARAVAASLEGALSRTAQKERWIAFFINIGAGLLIFIVGVFASDWIRHGVTSIFH